MKDIKVGVEKMTRNRRKMIEKTADSLLLSKHSIQFSALFLVLINVDKVKLVFDMLCFMFFHLTAVFFETGAMLTPTKSQNGTNCGSGGSFQSYLTHSQGFVPFQLF